MFLSAINVIMQHLQNVRKYATPASLAACASPNPVQDSSHHLPDPDDADTDLLSFTDPPVPTIKDSSLIWSASANCAQSYTSLIYQSLLC